MQSLARTISEQVPAAFKPLEEAKLNWAPVEQLRTVDIALFLGLLRLNLNDFYVAHHGPNWMEDKQEEMLEPGLVYVWYTSAKGLLGFVLFKVCENDDMIVLYLYEIHVNPEVHNQSIGTHLLTSFHALIPILHQCEHPHLQDIEGTGLTVFSDNVRAFEWYIRMGYQYTLDSPRDRKLRSGKIVKPDYYLLKWLYV
ncbi:uncharacterized protein CANTADRAFT_45487 [Suhomyces tanzawaensis NRRL Y-17324]|uniref:N-alpha-acetyltransferase 40 n=1 Tax=Suhomyces tanzawaensis NRRL Y-17324 TaxID=984487 RepID=A0A1E4SQG3_9ASCO|nr:uncharacterized protein CANTADRAFT_45487 [Suhomyces tanzawaensis NRRL Y-17324]ODV81735.1 hypothetical protein CANTADRAFT_45487 [Suhomyces tanzawaensis NRRL Y-17324]